MLTFSAPKAKLELDLQDLQVVLDGVSELQYKRAQPVMARIQQQLTAQASRRPVVVDTPAEIPGDIKVQA